MIFARACLIEIEKPFDAPDASGGVGGSAPTGGAAGSAGNGATGGTTGGSSGNDSGGADGCAKTCDGRCVGTTNPEFGCASPTCDRCTANAQAQCGDAGACVLIACNPGWVDCNNDAKDGCEVQFGPPGAPDGAVEELPDVGSVPGPDGGSANRPVYGVVGPNTITVDGDPSDWTSLSVPLIRLREPCVGCQNPPSKSPGGKPGVYVVNPDLPPGPSDLDAYYRITWVGGTLYALVLVKDDQIVSVAPAAFSDAGTFDPAETQDGVELFIDGNATYKNGYDENDHHVFIGAVSPGARPELLEPEHAGDPSISDLAAKVIRRDSCYFVELGINTSYLPGGTRPDAMARYGFTIAVNDWDMEEGYATAVRAHQVFWKHPGTLYGFETLFPRIELVTR